MKTAISIPDELFAEVDKKVAELETTRSQFLALAARHYLDSLAVSAVEAAVQQAVENIGNGGTDLVDHVWMDVAASRVLEETW
jgi:uncharacterized protein with PhoU and TrkA domain